MKKYKNSILVILLTFITLSCDSFLTTPPLDSITEDNWWSNKLQVEMMVKGCYNHLYGTSEVALRDCWSDNAIHRQSMKEIGNGTLTASSGTVRGQWKYDKIARLNYVLEGLEKAKNIISENEYKSYTSEVRFIRAFIYYDMLFYFGDVPLISKVITVEESRETSRQPRQEVLEFVLKELEDGVLPNIEAIPTTVPGRVNKQVVNTLLSRIYLYEGKYDKVVKYTNEVIKSNKYKLHPDYDALFRPQADGNNSEVIFERQYNAPLASHTLNRDLSYGVSPYRGWAHVRPLQSLVDEYECLNGHNIKDCKALGCEYYNQRLAANSESHRGEYDFRDPRMDATIVWSYKPWIADGKVRCVFEPDNKNSNDFILKEDGTGYLIEKWLNKKGGAADREISGKNMTIFRYADVLLMRAEALIELNQDLDEAVSLINEIRNRAHMPSINVASQAELRDMVRHERRIELAFEGLRYNDIIRWKIAEKVKKGKVYGAALKAIDPNMIEHKFIEKRFWEDYNYKFPIPQQALDNNPNLTQNPGY